MEIIFAIIIFGVLLLAIVAYVRSVFKTHREDKALEALFQLREAGSEEAVKSFLHALKSEFAEVRRRAASMLREMPEGRALESLISLTLEDKEFSIQNAEDRKEKKIEIVLRAIALVIGLTLVLCMIFELAGIIPNKLISARWIVLSFIISGLIAFYLSNHLELSRTVIWGFLGLLMPYLVLPVLAFKRSEAAPRCNKRGPASDQSVSRGGDEMKNIKQVHLYLEGGGDYKLVNEIIQALHPEFLRMPGLKIQKHDVTDWPSEPFFYVATDLIVHHGIKLTTTNCLTQDGSAYGKRLYLIMLKK